MCKLEGDRTEGEEEVSGYEVRKVTALGTCSHQSFPTIP